MPTEPELFEVEPELAGFRLHRFEVLNWGTFDKQIWKIEPHGNNALLTGDIGSGKSTLVDALTTLLVPAQRITYNQAAGAEKRERSLLSYVRGHYKSERDEERFAARSVPLRGEGSYSVLLGHFHNAGFQQDVTLAQVFWTAAQGQPERFYAVADRPLSIGADFAGFGQEMAALKKRLRKDPRVALFDSFVQYAQDFRRRMEIRSDKALELFYQTVSMKAVGNLTDFVRGHMLDQPEPTLSIEDIVRNFDNLNRAHEAVLKARDQVRALEPLAADCEACAREEAENAERVCCREALTAFYAEKKVKLLDERMARLATDLARLEEQDLAAMEGSRRLAAEREGLQTSIRESGGGRLEALDREEADWERQRRDRQGREAAYARCRERLELPSAEDVAGFYENRRKAGLILEETETGKRGLEERRVDVQVRLRERKERSEELNRELTSLRARRSSIPAASLDLRRRLCETLAVEESELPFAGELIQVRPEQADWEGALERLLHNFGLSLLVPSDLYDRIARYVDSTHLRGRLVYYGVKDDEGRPSPGQSNRALVLHKLQIKPDNHFRGWLEAQVARQFDYVCCEAVEDFQKQPKALTRQGQTKGLGRRHEKDDRRPLGDRSNYILGWDNREKIEALEGGLDQLVREEVQDREILHGLEKSLQEMEGRREAARDLLAVLEFADIDWQFVLRNIARIQEERRQVVESSDLLRTLQDSLKLLEAAIVEIHEKSGRVKDDLGKHRERKEQARRLREESLAQLERVGDGERKARFPMLEAMRLEAFAQRSLSVESCDNAQVEHREWLQGRIDAGEKRKGHLAQVVVKRMMEFKQTWPLETKEFDANMASAGDFGVLLQRLTVDDLPRHEGSFKALLHEGSINDIGLLQSQLDVEQAKIREKIGLINRSLKGIEYSAGTYIELAEERTLDSEVRDFQQRLRECLEGSLAGGEGDTYSEEKFLRVKDIVGRFKGREGLSEVDQRWTRKVTDVRHWFEFLVHERWRENGESKEVYSDSSGKSGGQKEKLAYTILASALAYQFGMSWGESRSRGFRFVMIDEAFGRGSDESARYALELFKKLNLQLLIVTPLQKLHVIEDYVRAIHFVHNRDGRSSMIRNLDIETHKKERALKEAGGAAQ
jgi:uncharacterized protein YPO0396